MRKSLLLSVGLACGIASLSFAEEPKQLGKVLREKDAIDKLLAKDAQMEILADGFEWSEGPVYVPKGDYVIFSDIPRNQIVKWKEGEGKSIFAEKVGFTGPDTVKNGEPGTNGLMLDAEGRLYACCHGDRCIKKLGDDGKYHVVADKYDGKRFNSPNDLVFHKNGDLYFTDPPYGLPKGAEDPSRELDFCGVYRYSNGKVTLLTKEMTRPNGIAFSPDYKTLYVANSDPDLAIWKAFPVKEDGTLGEGKVLFDSTEWVKKKMPGLPDGMAVDVQGNIWATGPGGVLVLSPKGDLLGRLDTGEATANCEFGGKDKSTLYITADMYFVRIPTLTKGF